MSKKYYNYRLAEHKKPTLHQHKTILVLQRQPGSHRWCGHEGQVHNHTSRSEAPSVGPTPSQPHGYQKKLLVCKSVYWVNIDNDIEDHLKYCNTYLQFQHTQPKEKIIHHDIPLRPWEVLGVDIFHLSNKNYLCVVDYDSKFPVIKRMEGLSAENPHHNSKNHIC